MESPANIGLGLNEIYELKEELGNMDDKGKQNGSIQNSGKELTEKKVSDMMVRATPKLRKSRTTLGKRRMGRASENLDRVIHRSIKRKVEKERSTYNKREVTNKHKSLDNEDKCPKCTKKVEDGVECGQCKKWLCYEFVGMTREDVHDKYESDEEFLCKFCEEKFESASEGESEDEAGVSEITKVGIEKDKDKKEGEQVRKRNCKEDSQSAMGEEGKKGERTGRGDAKESEKEEVRANKTTDRDQEHAEESLTRNCEETIAQTEDEEVRQQQQQQINFFLDKSCHAVKNSKNCILVTR